MPDPSLFRSRKRPSGFALYPVYLRGEAYVAARQVQAILTPEQQKFAQMKEKAKERRGHTKDKGQSDHQPPQ